MSTLHDVKVRRRPITYGKPARNRDQIFGYVKTDIAVQNISKVITNHESPVSHLDEREETHQPTSKPQSIRKPHQILGHGTFEGSEIRRTADSTERTTKLRHKTASNDASLFEVPSSDEDLEGLQTTSRKRQRLTPAREEPSSRREILHENDDSSLRFQSQNARRSKRDRSRSSQKQPPNLVPLKSRSTTSEMTASAAKSLASSQSAALRHPTSPLTDTESGPDIGMNVTMRFGSPPKSSPEPPVTPKSDRSARSSYIQDLLDWHGVSDTPSRLSINGLRLSSEERSVSPSSELNTFGRSVRQILAPAMRTRTRLVDTLSQSQPDALSSPESSSDNSMVVDGKAEESLQPQAMVEESVEQVIKVSEKPVDPDPTENSYPIIKGPKITYAMQRSYLSDMVEDEGVDSSVPSFSQSSDLGLPSKSTLSNSFSHDVTHELLSDDDDNVGGSGAIRSVHELRKAGVNAHFESTVESLFEDIESSANGRRLTGLTQLCNKLVDDEFKRQFLDHYLDRRLTRCDASDASVLGSTLTASVFLTLLHASQPSLKTVERCLQRVVKSSLMLLKEQRDILDLAKERRQNLSKALQNDLRAFKEQQIASAIWADQKPVKLTPAILCLRAIELMLRRLRELGDLGFHINPEVFSAIVNVLDTSHQANSGSNHLLALSMAVSILESFTVGIVKLGPEYVNALKKLTNPFKLMSALSSDNPATTQTQELFLRLILNMTNNNEELCDVFAQPALISTIFDQVHSQFNKLSTTSSASETEPISHLNTVILSLGALINFAEWSGKARCSMLQLHTSTGEPYIDWLTATFKSNVATFLEASSAAQSHAMVTFGYLSVLLTTLCLEEVVRVRVREKLLGKSLRAVFVAVEEFLKHMRKVEEDERLAQDRDEDGLGNNGDGSERVSDFAERFQAVVRQLRRAERI